MTFPEVSVLRVVKLHSRVILLVIHEICGNALCFTNKNAFGSQSPQDVTYIGNFLLGASYEVNVYLCSCTTLSYCNVGGYHRYSSLLCSLHVFLSQRY